MPSYDPLPSFYYYFFAFFEPISTIAGAAICLYDPSDFYLQLIPRDFKQVGSSGILKGAVKHAFGVGEASRVVDDEGRMAVAMLGSCYLLLAMISGLVIPTIKRTLLFSPSTKATNEQIASSLLTSLFLALAIADWIHILLTLHYLPPVLNPLDTTAWINKLTTLATHPTSWNGLLFGNVVVTFGLFCVRSAWFLGIGRQVNGSTTTTAAVAKSKKGQ